MSIFGSIFGAVATSASEEEEEEEAPEAIEAPFTSADTEFVDIVEEAIDRLTQQFQGD